MGNNYGELYKNKEYLKLIECLNPNQDPNCEIYKWATFYYVWSIEREYFGKTNFYYKLERKRFEYLINEIRRNVQSDHILIGIIKTKQDIYKRMEIEGKIFPQSSPKLLNTYIPKSNPWRSNTKPEPKPGRYKPKKSSYVPYEVYTSTARDIEDAELQESKYERADQSHDFDDITAKEQGNLKW